VKLQLKEETISRTILSQVILSSPLYNFLRNRRMFKIRFKKTIRERESRRERERERESKEDGGLTGNKQRELIDKVIEKEQKQTRIAFTDI
jgi:hypothetical protein